MAEVHKLEDTKTREWQLRGTFDPIDVKAVTGSQVWISVNRQKMKPEDARELAKLLVEAAKYVEAGIR